MSESRRLQHAAIGCGLVLAALLLPAVFGVGPYLASLSERSAAQHSGYDARNDPYSRLGPCQDTGPSAEGRPQRPCDAHYYERRDLPEQASTATATWAQFGLGIVNLILLGATLVLSINATRAATEASKTARQELEVLERPYLQAVGDAFEPLDSVEEGTAYRYGPGAHASIKFYNYGRAPATLLRIHATLVWGDHFGERVEPVIPADSESRVLPFGSVVPPEKFSDPYWSTQRIPAENFIPPDETEWWLIGFLRYEDAFANQFLMGFCLRRSRGAWVRSGPFGKDAEQYNYVRKVDRPAKRQTARERLTAAWAALFG